MAKIHKQVEIKGRDYPVHVFYERRNSIRFALGKEAILVRFPKGLSAAEEAKHWKRLQTWLHKLPHDETSPLAQYHGRDYQDGDTIRVGSRQYELNIKEAARQTSKANLKKGIIKIVLNDAYDSAERQKTIAILISRIVGQDFLPEITAKVQALNEKHFQKPIQSVKLKNTSTRWGSCSTKGNINLSTRLLFAPPKVVDYVIIHELAHLIQANHSPAFWREVARAMPDYKQHVKWLRVHGRECYY